MAAFPEQPRCAPPGCGAGWAPWREASPAPVVYHEPNLIARPFDGVTVLTIDDLSWRVDRDFHPGQRTAWIERRLPGSIAQATRFVAISAFTAGEMVRELGIPRDRVDVVPLAPSAVFRPMPPDEAVASWIGTTCGRPASCSPSPPWSRARISTGCWPPTRSCPTPCGARHPLAIAGGQGWGGALKGGQADRALRAGISDCSGMSRMRSWSRCTRGVPRSPSRASTRASACR